MQVTIEPPDISAVVNRLRLLGSAEMMREAHEAMAEGVQQKVMENFRRKNAAPARPGWPKSDFYESAAESVTTSSDNDGATVTITKEGVALRLYGGTVSASDKKLAIPADPKVAGMWPRNYPGEIYLAFRKKYGRLTTWLAETDGVTERLLWLLKDQTTHKPDTTVLPSRDDMSAAAVEAAEAIIQ